MPRTRDALLAALDEGSLAPDHLDALLRARDPEDLWLDYKRGAFVDPAKYASKKQRNLELRKYVAGFANADGGLLLIGVAGAEGEDAWSIAGCDPGHVVDSLAEWATRTLTPLAPYLRPAPRIFEVEHPMGRVLAIAVDRAPVLVPYVEDGEVRHSLRIGDQTLVIDPYLYADLVLGRRERPDLNITSEHQAACAHGSFSMRHILQVENRSLVWVDELAVGVVGYLPESDPGEWERVPSAIERYLDDQKKHASGAALRMSMTRVMGGLAPLHAATVEVVVPIPMNEHDIVWHGAAYAVPSNGPPVWAQSVLHVNYHRGCMIHEPHLVGFQTLGPGERPRVSTRTSDGYADEG